MNRQTESTLNNNETQLARTYFYKWKNYLKNKQDDTEQLKTLKVQKEKLACFLKSLKHHQRQKQHSSTLQQQRFNLKNQHSHGSNSNKIKTKQKLQGDFLYANRFKAQQEIIQFQKVKLIEQEKLIQNLKLGKLDEEITQSLQETEQEIKEMFGKCSFKIKCKLKSTGMIKSEEPITEFRLNSIKAPKIIQRMQRQALEREHKRHIIMEKKKMLEQMKKHATEIEIERKQAQDDEERKKNLQAMKERRMKDLELHRLLQAKKQQFLQSCEQADHLYKRKLITFGFKAFTTLIVIKNSNIRKSIDNYKLNLKRKSIKHWLEFLKQIEYPKLCKAERLYNFKLKATALQIWFKTCVVATRCHLQVAEDLYDMRLQSKTFIHWHRFVCTQYMLEYKNLQRATAHYTSHILLHYFYLWKSLPVVIQLEKTKEEKKRKWREKVWEIIPDYAPVIDN